MSGRNIFLSLGIFIISVKGQTILSSWINSENCWNCVLLYVKCILMAMATFWELYLCQRSKDSVLNASSYFKPSLVFQIKRVDLDYCRVGLMAVGWTGWL